MAERSWKQTITDTELESVLHAASEQIAYPTERDLGTQVRHRIEQESSARSSSRRSAQDQTSGNSTDLVRSPTDSANLQERRPSRRHELALLAGGLVAAAALIIVLTVVFRGFADNDSDQPGPATGPTPSPDSTETSNVPAIPGYDFVQTIGQPAVPNQPIAILKLSADRYLVVDPGLGRLIAYTADGQIDTGWGDDGLSPRIGRPADVAVGPEGTIYAISQDRSTLTVLSPEGQMLDQWDMPVLSEQATPNPTAPARSASQLVNPAIAVTSDGVVNVGLWNNEVLRFDQDGEQLESIPFERSMLADIATGPEGNLLALTKVGTIYQHADGWEEVATTEATGEPVNVMSTPNDGYAVMYWPRSQPDSPSIVVLDSQGAEVRRINLLPSAVVQVLSTGILIGEPLFEPDGTLLVPLPAYGQVRRYTSDDSSEVWIDADQDPTHFDNLYRIAFDEASNLYALDYTETHYVVHSFTQSGEYRTRLEAIEIPLPTPVYVLGPEANLAVAPDGQIAVGFVGLSRVGVYNPDGSFKSDINLFAALPNQMVTGVAMAAAPDDSLYILGQSGYVAHITADGELIEELPRADAEPRQYSDLIYHDGDLIAALDGSILILEEGSDEWETIFEANLDVNPLFPYALAMTPDGHLLATALKFDEDEGRDQVLMVFDDQMQQQQTIPLNIGEQFRYLDIAVTPDGTIALSDSSTLQIHLYEPNGTDLDVTPPQPPSTQVPIEEPQSTQTGAVEDSAAPQVPGYEFVQAVGEPAIPNRPVAIRRVSDDRYLVVDPGLGKLIAYTAEGKIDTSWSDGGFSPSLGQPIDAAIGPNGNIYVIGLGRTTVSVLSADGQVVDSLALPLAEIPAPESTQQSITPTEYLLPSIAVTSDGTIHVLIQSSGILRMGPSGESLGRLPSEANDWVDIDTTSEGGLLVLTREGVIYQFNDGSWDVQPSYPIEGEATQFTMAPDGRYAIVFHPTSDLNASQLAVVDDDIVESLINAGEVDPAFTSEGALLIPDPGTSQILRLEPQGQSEDTTVWVSDPNESHFSNLNKIAFDSAENLYMLSYTGDYVVRAFNLEGQHMLTLSADELIQPADKTGRFPNELGIAVTTDGQIVVSDFVTGTIAVYAPDGSLIRTISLGLEVPGPAMALTAGPDNSLYIMGVGGATGHYALDGTLLEELPPADDGQPMDLLFHDDKLWAIADGKIFRLAQGSDNWDLVRDLGDPIETLPYSLSVTPDGRLQVIAQQFDENGGLTTILMTFDQSATLQETIPLLDNGLGQLPDIAIAQDGRLALSDPVAHTIYLYEPTS